MSEKKYLEKDQVPYLLTKIKGKIPTKTSQITNDSGFITTSDIPEGAAASTTTPKMNGTAAVGEETAFARGDHVHPSDTAKVDKVTGKGLSTNDFTNDLKTKLEGIATGANKTTVDSALSSSSTNPVQNKVVNTALANKVDKASGKGLSTNDFTTAEKTKLGTVEENANYIEVDTVLDASSTNPPSSAAVVQGLNSVSSNAIKGVTIYGDNTDNLSSSISLDLPKGTDGKVSLSAGGGLSVQKLTNGGVRLHVECGEWLIGSYSPASIRDTMSAIDDLSTSITNTLSSYAKKEDITSMMEWKGSVATYDKLPTNADKGDTYNVESDGMNYTWTGTVWDAAGSTFTINSITNAEIDAMFTDW